MRRHHIFIGILSIAVFASCKKDLNSTPDQVSDLSATQALNNGQGEIAAEAFVPNELLVKFKAGTAETVRANVLARIGGSVSEKVLTKAMERAGDGEGFLVIRTSLHALEAISKARGFGEVEYAEPNYIYTYGAVSNDTYFTNGSLWGMNGTYGCQADKAWAAGHTGSSNVYVGIIDEGAMYNHEDLAGNFGNPKEIAGNGKDDDGNGYIDDAYGYDFANNDNTTFDGSIDDHGTHVSGTIGGIGGNGKGVAGVNWSVKMISAKFLGRNGGTTANSIKAVDYITDLKTRDGLNIVATNNSWGGGGFSQGLQDAIERANQAGILFIAAAGNGGSDGVGDNNDAVANYPSNYPNANIIAVAAITSSGGLASFSNYGATTVDIGAPGYGIYSTVPTKSGGSGYASYSGTSMATPHVTGAAALYASAKSLSPKTATDAASIKQALLSAGTLTPSLSGKCVTGARLNVSSF
jgi:subtilisin family serine protease